MDSGIEILKAEDFVPEVTTITFTSVGNKVSLFLRRSSTRWKAPATLKSTQPVSNLCTSDNPWRSSKDLYDISLLPLGTPERCCCTPRCGNSWQASSQ